MPRSSHVSIVLAALAGAAGCADDAGDPVASTSTDAEDGSASGNMPGSTSGAATSGAATSGTDGSTTDDGDAATTSVDEGGPTTEGDTGNPITDGGGACPVPFGALDCATTCDLFVWECESCPARPGDLCTYYPHQLDACLTGCASLTDPGDFTYEVFACRQSVGMVCDEDAVAQCLLDIDCA